MATFKDSKDREWTIDIDAPKIMAIRSDCDEEFLLHDDEKSNTYGRMQADPVLLCRVIYLLCNKEREARGVSEEEFYLGVIGDAIDRATDALLEAIVSFTPRRTRALLEMFAAQESFRHSAMEKALGKISDPQLMEEVKAQMEAKMELDFQAVLTQLQECYKLAGFVGVHPGHLTMRELAAMACGKAEILGGTSGASSGVAPYDPTQLMTW